MSYIESLPRIDRYLCKFENPIHEQDFTSHRLKKISKILTFSYFLFAVAIAADIYDLYSRIESLHPLMLMNVVISISMLFLGLSRGEFKITNYSTIFMVVFIVFNTYQAYLFGVLLPKWQAVSTSSAGDIVFMPFLLIITLVVVPFNFLTSLIIAVLAMIVNLPMLFLIPDLNPIYIFFGIVVPFAILIFNKWSG